MKNYQIKYLHIYSLNWILRVCLISNQAWARREALAREKVVENGGEIEFGKWYQSVQFQEDEIDNMPIVKEE